MAFPETDPNRPLPSNSDTAASDAPRPSWETARSAAAPRPAALPGRPAPPVPVADPAPYYRSPAPPPPAPVYSAPVYQAPLDSDVKYDLAGNPIPGTGSASAAAALPGRIVYSGGEATGSWPPAPASPYSGGWQGSVGAGTDQVATLRWNWGAFLIPFWWSVFNGQRGLASVITLANVTSRFLPAPYDWAGSVVSLGISIYLGCMGHRLAWSSDRFGGDYDNFIRTQRAWMIWGFALMGVTVGAVVLFALMIPGFLAALGGAHPVHHHYGSYSQPYGSSSSSNGDGTNAPSSN